MIQLNRTIRFYFTGGHLLHTVTHVYMIAMEKDYPVTKGLDPEVQDNVDVTPHLHDSDLKIDTYMTY